MCEINQVLLIAYVVLFIGGLWGVILLLSRSQPLEDYKEWEGECVPVAVTDEDGIVDRVFCQNCTKPMTQKEHKEYFDWYVSWYEGKFNQKYRMERPKYDLGS